MRGIEAVLDTAFAATALGVSRLAGSATVAQLRGNGLIDEMHLSIVPILPGSGRSE